MLFSDKHQIRLACIAVLSFLFTSGVFAQIDVNQVVKAQNSGSDLYITIDHSALRLFNDSAIARLNPDGDGEWNTWKDVLTNGNSPGMDVDFDGWSANGILNLTASGTATFTGNVKGPKATANDEYVTYDQLDSLASVAPFNETYRLFKNTGGTPQTITSGSTNGLLLSGFGTNIYSEVSAQAAAQTLQLPFSVQASAQGGGLQVIALSDPGVYEIQLTAEVDPNALANPDIYVLVELYNYDALQSNGLPTTRVLAADAQVVHDAAAFGGQVSAHFNMSMAFIADNPDEEVYVKITPTGGDVDVVTFGFSVARKGEN